MSVVTATNLRKELSGDPLFDGVSFRVGRRDRVSLSGPNGAGKTTLLRILNGETELHGGKLSMAKGTRIALHDQRPPAESGASLRDYVLSGAADLTAAEQELRRLEEAMAAGDHEAATLRQYSETQARLEHAGGYAWRERLDSVTRNLGFTSDALERPLSTFSGGELTRASLARALGGDPDLLLLDEPTNHLDVASLEWLERELQSIDAAVVLVAHDRWFLEAVTTAVLELEAGRSTYFAGPWHNWRREKAARLAAATTAAQPLRRRHRPPRALRRALPRQEESRQARAGQDHADRPAREGAGRGQGRDLAAHATGEEPRLRVPAAEAQRSNRRRGRGRRARRGRQGAPVAACRLRSSGASTSRSSARTARGRRPCSRPCSAAGSPLPESSSSGTASRPRTSPSTRSSSTRAGRSWRSPRTPPGLQRPQAQNLLGRFLFTGWEMHERSVAVLSGGERRRLALALIVASGANLLLLDEPTNHLDLESREALEAALDAFPGTILLVSHDRALLDAIADRTLALEDGTIRSYDGGWAEYVAARDERKAVAEPVAGKPKKAKSPRARKPAGPSELESLEAEIAAREADIAGSRESSPRTGRM